MADTGTSPNDLKLRRRKPAPWVRGPFLMYVLPLPLAVAAVIDLVGGNAGRLVIDAAMFGLFMLAAALAQKGIRQEAEYQSKRFATRPIFPAKLLAGLVTGAACFLTAFLTTKYGLAAAGGFGAGGLLGFFLYYGFDPMSKKAGLETHGYTIGEIGAAVDEANARIDAIRESRNKIKSPELRERLTRIAALAWNIVDEVEQDPKDLAKVRKFLEVYLDGAQKVTTEYAAAHAGDKSEELEERFRKLAVTIESAFEEQLRKLRDDEKLDLDVQMEVLSTQLKEEGVA